METMAYDDHRADGPLIWHATHQSYPHTPHCRRAKECLRNVPMHAVVGIMVPSAPWLSIQRFGLVIDDEIKDTASAAVIPEVGFISSSPSMPTASITKDILTMHATGKGIPEAQVEALKGGSMRQMAASDGRNPTSSLPPPPPPCPAPPNSSSSRQQELSPLLEDKEKPSQLLISITDTKKRNDDEHYGGHTLSSAAQTPKLLALPPLSPLRKPKNEVVGRLKPAASWAWPSAWSIYLCVDRIAIKYKTSARERRLLPLFPHCSSTSTSLRYAFLVLGSRSMIPTVDTPLRREPETSLSLYSNSQPTYSRIINLPLEGRARLSPRTRWHVPLIESIDKFDPIASSTYQHCTIHMYCSI
ncbi:hypothetical protein GW17_00018447 [Ensete ventricosum]|nr:hypothetical protein GW17_00018447 [Ensete ventricosum]